MVLFVYNHGSFVYSRSVMNQLFTFLHRGSFTFFSYYSLYSSFVYTFRDICRRIIRTSLTNTSIIEYFYIRSRREKANRKFWLKIINEAMDFFISKEGSEPFEVLFLLFLKEIFARTNCVQVVDFFSNCSADEHFAGIKIRISGSDKSTLFFRRINIFSADTQIVAFFSKGKQKGA